MSVQVDPMAASVVAAALGTYPTLLPQWCLPPREAPHVNVQAHQDNASGADQPLDLSAKPKNSQVSPLSSRAPLFNSEINLKARSGRANFTGTRYVLLWSRFFHPNRFHSFISIHSFFNRGSILGPSFQFSQHPLS